LDGKEILVFVLENQMFTTVVIKTLSLNIIQHNSMYTAFLLSLFCALQMSRDVPGDTVLCNKFLGQTMEERTCSNHSYLLFSE
jgi:hypothetical protein